MKNIALGLSAMAMTVALGGAAIAAADAPAMERAMANATITRAQAQAHAEAAFARMDLNHDGQISREEFTAAHSKMRPMMGHDTPPADAMQGMDHGAMGGPKAGAMGGKGMMMRGARMGMMMGILRAADPQHTGTVSKDAFVAAALKMFDGADTNHDGKVTPEERKAAMRAHGRHMMPPPAKPAGA